MTATTKKKYSHFIVLGVRVDCNEIDGSDITQSDISNAVVHRLHKLSVADRLISAVGLPKDELDEGDFITHVYH